MLTLREKAIALSVIGLLNFSVLVFGPLYLLVSGPISALFAVAVVQT